LGIPGAASDTKSRLRTLRSGDEKRICGGTALRVYYKSPSSHYFSFAVRDEEMAGRAAGRSAGANSEQPGGQTEQSWRLGYLGPRVPKGQVRSQGTGRDF